MAPLTRRDLLGLSVTLLSCGASRVHAVSDTSFKIEDLMRPLAAVKHGKARFVEERTMTALKVTMRSSGTLAYAAPSDFEKHTTEPKEEIVRLSGDRLSIERPAEGWRRSFRVSDEPELGALVEGIRGTLSGDIAALERHFDIQLAGSRNVWQITLTPTGPRVQRLLSAIHVIGSGAVISEIRIVERGGDRSVMQIFPADH